MVDAEAKLEWQFFQASCLVVLAVFLLYLTVRDLV